MGGVKWPRTLMELGEVTQSQVDWGSPGWTKPGLAASLPAWGFLPSLSGKGRSSLVCFLLLLLMLLLVCFIIFSKNHR